MFNPPNAVEAVEMLARASIALDALIAKGASPGTLSMAALEAEFWGAELRDTADRLKAAALEMGLEAVG